MKLIIAGGRGYLMTDKDLDRLDKIDNVTEVVSGGAKGADLGGEKWAESKGIPVKKFLPEWKKYGRAAGPERNREMVKYADAVAVFPGGKGTLSLYNLSKKAGLLIYDWRNI